MGLWLPACSAAALAHSSAFSFPATPLCAGHHRISMTIPGLALRSVAMDSSAGVAEEEERRVEEDGGSREARGGEGGGGFVSDEEEVGGGRYRLQRMASLRIHRRAAAPHVTQGWWRRRHGWVAAAQQKVHTAGMKALAERWESTRLRLAGSVRIKTPTVGAVFTAIVTGSTPAARGFFAAVNVAGLR